MQFSWSFWQANYGPQALCLTPLIYSISQLWKSLFCFALLIFSNALHHTLISRLSSMMTSSCDSAASSCEYQCLISGSSLISICFGTLTRLTLITSVEVVKTTLYCMSVWFRWAVSLTEWEEVVPRLGAGMRHDSTFVTSTITSCLFYFSSANPTVKQQEALNPHKTNSDVLILSFVMLLWSGESSRY